MRPAARGLFDAEEYARQRAYFTTRRRDDAAGARCPALAASLGARRALAEGRDRALRAAGVQEPRRRVRGAPAGRARRAGRRHHARLRQRRQSRPRRGARGPVGRARRHHLPRRRRRPGAGRGDRERRAPTSSGSPAPTTTPCATPPPMPPPPAAWSSPTRRGTATTRIPHDIMLGYTRLMDEAAAAWAGDGPPDVLLVQAGVGGLLAAVASWSAWTFGAERPRLVAVEPTLAACVQASARAGRPTPNRRPAHHGDGRPALRRGLAAGLRGRGAAGRRLSRRGRRLDPPRHAAARPPGRHGDPPLAVGASGAAGIAALLALREDPALAGVAEAIGLTSSSRVFVIATEGVTEPELWNDVCRRAGLGARVPGSARSRRIRAGA